MELTDAVMVSGVIAVFVTFMVVLAWVSRNPRR